MNLNEAKLYSDSYRNNNPEGLISLGGDYNLSDDKLMETIKLAEIFWIVGDIPERTAFERALKLVIKDNQDAN